MHITKSKIEKKINNQFGFLYGKITNSGSEAIKYCFINAKIKKYSLVIVPVTMCQSVVNTIIEFGCYPYFVDVDNDFCLDYNKLSSIPLKNIGAIIYVHAYGILKDITKIKDFTKQRGIILIEDSAQYVSECNRYIDAPQGDFVIYSFGNGKPIDVGNLGYIASNYYNIKNTPIIKNKKNILLLDKKILKINSIIQTKKDKVNIYKNLLDNTSILDNNTYIDNMFHRLLYSMPTNYYDISNKMYAFMKTKNIDNYQSTIPIEAFRDEKLKLQISNNFQDLNIDNFSNYKRLKESYHYFRTSEWINENNILEICNYFNNIIK